MFFKKNVDKVIDISNWFSDCMATDQRVVVGVIRILGVEQQVEIHDNN